MKSIEIANQEDWLAQAMPAIHLAIQGRGIHLVTPDNTLLVYRQPTSNFWVKLEGDSSHAVYSGANSQPLMIHVATDSIRMPEGSPRLYLDIARNERRNPSFVTLCLGVKALAGMEVVHNYTAREGRQTNHLRKPSQIGKR